MTKQSFKWELEQNEWLSFIILLILWQVTQEIISGIQTIYLVTEFMSAFSPNNGTQLV